MDGEGRTSSAIMCKLKEGFLSGGQEKLLSEDKVDANDVREKQKEGDSQQ